MLEYDEKRNRLIFYQTKDMDINLDIFSDIRASYKEYLDKIIYSDVDYLVQSLNNYLSSTNISAKVEVGSLYESPYRPDHKKVNNKYYPVYCTFTSHVGELRKVEVFHIPFMDSECKLNYEGRRKVMLMEQQASNDISYQVKKQTLTIQSVRLSTSFKWSKKGPCIKLRSNDGKSVRWKRLDTVCRGLLSKEGVDPNFQKEITNSILVSCLSVNEYFNDILNADYEENLGIYNRFKNESAALGFSRIRLNELLQLDPALGEVLSRDTLSYQAGTVVDEKILKDLKKNKLHVVYVKDKPSILGFYLKQFEIFNAVPKGTQNCNILRRLLSQEADNATISKDYVFDDVIVPELYFPIDTQIDKEILELLQCMGVTEIMCSSSKTSESHTYRFEREIMTNRSYRLSDIDTSIKKDSAQDMWLYTYRDEDQFEYLTGYDLIGIISLFGRMQSTGENPLMDKDTAYLKKVNLIGDTMSMYFRRAVPRFIKTQARALGTFFAGRGTSGTPFYGLWNQVRKDMVEGKVLVDADTVNVLAELSQVCHVTTIMQSKHSVDEEQRKIAIPYFGRLCPYETPAGKNLGITNTKAIGAKVINNQLCVPYRAVLQDGDSRYLSDKVEYLNVVQCQKLRISDYSQLVMEADGKHFKDTSIIAIIPNPMSPNNDVMFSNLSSYKLDYVTCNREQHLSLAATMIPFEEHNDANRINYALNMMRQSIYLTDTDVPCTQTSMYEDIFNYASSFLLRAEKSGTVSAIERGRLVVVYDDEPDGFTETIIPVEETRITNESVVFCNYKVNVGQHFNKGDILVDTSISNGGVYRPSRNVLVAYVATGYNYEDGVDAIQEVAYKFISLKSEKVDTKIKGFMHKSKRIEANNKYRYVPPGDVVTTIELSEGSKGKPVSIPLKSEKGGILYNVETLRDVNAFTYRANVLSFNVLQTGDKMAGRHGNKGVATHIGKTSSGLQLANGKVIELYLNPHGVPSRMNLGQILDAHMGLIATVLFTTVESNPFNGATVNEIRMLMKFTHELANTPNIDKSRSVFDSVVSKYTDIPQSFKDHCWSVITKIIDWRDTFDEKGDARLYDPDNHCWLEFPVTIGCVPMLKLMQEVEEKKHSRSGLLEEPYSALTRQPPKGSRKGGGQRMGEMELVDCAAYGAVNYLGEIMNECSDNAGARANIHLEKLGFKDRVDEKFCVPRSYEVLSYEAEALGIKIDTSNDNELVDLDNYYVNNCYCIDVKRAYLEAQAFAYNDEYLTEKDIERDQLNEIAADRICKALFENWS